MKTIACSLILGLVVLPPPSVVLAQDTGDAPKTLDRKALAKAALAASNLGSDTDPTQARSKKEMQELYAKFTKLLTGAKLRGQFTIDGRPMNQLVEETYEIQTVEKQPKGDTWIVTARIKYGKYDTVFPVPLDVAWAGRTPVMTLDNMTIPGMGTFGARVVFHKDKYAGTWSHDEVGGHMFGKVIFAEDEKEADASDSESISSSEIDDEPNENASEDSDG
ncbi:MAG: hypothetical protein VXZ82_16110 [Planctomycetota bacterium]|nr:hypothetical protein [Planctomycetota bacterium]